MLLVGCCCFGNKMAAIQFSETLIFFNYFHNFLVKIQIFAVGHGINFSDMFTSVENTSFILVGFFCPYTAQRPYL